MIEVSDEEVTMLLDYFINRAGYISYELDMPLHIFIKRLQNYEKDHPKEIHSKKSKEQS